MNFKTFIIIFLSGFVVVAFVVYRIVAVNTVSVDDFAKTGAIAATLLTSLGAIIASIYTAYRTAELEKDKVDLGAKLEFLKQKLTDKRKAYQELHQAIANYYFTLEKAVHGELNHMRVEESEAKMISAKYYLLVCDPEHQVLWLEFYQSARNFTDRAKGLSANELKALWEQSVKELGENYTNFKNMAEKVLSSFQNPK